MCFKQSFKKENVTYWQQTGKVTSYSESSRTTWDAAWILVDSRSDWQEAVWLTANQLTNKIRLCPDQIVAN